MQLDTPNTAAVHIMPVIRVYDDAGDVIEMHEHKGEFKECEFLLASRRTSR
jgi:hypothetical protein